MPSKIKARFLLNENPYYKMSQFDINGYNIDFLDVNETISELSYLTHSYFRYYGKFPSKIGKMILEILASQNLIISQNDIVLDNYAGSGTSLVESKLKGFDSFGIDINPFAVLACKVKTRNYDMTTLYEYWKCLKEEIVEYNKELFNDTQTSLTFMQTSYYIKKKIDNEINDFMQINKDAKKWFSEDTIKGIAIIKQLILERSFSQEREFFELAFFAIIRRVSFAYDGEVRPHVNQKKKVRNIAEAYIKKVNEMLKQMKDWNAVTSELILADAILCNNSDRESVNSFISKLKIRTKKELGLVISHPPYLNCFDYIPIYKLNFMWSNSFDDIFADYNYKQIKSMELKSYPANSHKNIKRYFEHNKSVYQIIYDNLRSKGYCCVVIGDCTIKEQLFEVHKSFISMLEQIGFEAEKIVFRSTAYGIGQYAYRFRADYNQDKNRKKDGIIFFKKP